MGLDPADVELQSWMVEKGMQMISLNINEYVAPAGEPDMLLYGCS